jgi:HD-like signal output (HDOD) protein
VATLVSDKLNFDELKAEGVLPSPRGVALTVMQLCQQEDIALPVLAHTILGDPALAGHIIKLANIVNPNKNRPIASVTTDTLILIGIHAIRQAVIGHALITAYQKGKCSEFDYRHFWSNSAAMACAAQSIGTVVRIAPLAEVFTCGLLAEVGQLGLATARPDAYSTLLKQYAGKPLNELIQAESHQFGMDRRTLAGAMLADWGMPRLFVDAVSFYDRPGNSGFAPGSRHLNLILTLQLAALLANIYTAPDHARAALVPGIFEIGTTLDLNAERVVAIANQAALDWLDWGELLNIKTSAVPLFETADDAGEVVP